MCVSESVGSEERYVCVLVRVYPNRYECVNGDESEVSVFRIDMSV